MNMLELIQQDTGMVNRFNKFFDRGDIEECWLWKGACKIDPLGRYGIITVANPPHRRKHVAAHRFSLYVVTGILPDDKQACHKCNNPSCVNPHHLYWGTYHDNVMDRRNKWGKDKLLYNNIDEARSIKMLVMGTRRKDLDSLAKKLGISFGTVNGIKYGTAWKDVVI